MRIIRQIRFQVYSTLGLEKALSGILLDHLKDNPDGQHRYGHRIPPTRPATSLSRPTRLTLQREPGPIQGEGEEVDPGGLEDKLLWYECPLRHLRRQASALAHDAGTMAPHSSLAGLTPAKCKRLARRSWPFFVCN
jgi:hypothetical protein